MLPVTPARRSRLLASDVDTLQLHYHLSEERLRGFGYAKPKLLIIRRCNFAGLAGMAALV